MSDKISHRPMQMPRVWNLEALNILCLADTEASQTLVDALQATKLSGRDQIVVPDWDVRVRAATIIKDRLYGKPRQEIEYVPPKMAPSLDATKLTDEELAAYNLLMKAKERIE